METWMMVLAYALAGFATVGSVAMVFAIGKREIGFVDGLVCITCWPVYVAASLGMLIVLAIYQIARKVR